MIVAVFPGQGSQTPGFLRPWLELDGVRERLESYSEHAGLDIIEAGTLWEAEAIRATDVAQPLIVAASLVSWHALTGGTPHPEWGIAGHSVGEIAALVAAGVLSDEDAMRLVGIRGRAMAAAAAAAHTGMSAVLGGDEEVVLDALAGLGLTPANYNAPGQIVAAGAIEALQNLGQNPPAGSRVIALEVAGAFHTTYMEPAVATLAEAAAATPVSDPVSTLWTNRDGTIVADGRTALDLVVDQVASPVRWDRCMESFAAAGVTGIIEFSPAGTLTGLAKRALRGVGSVAVKTPDELAAALDLVGEQTA